MPASAFAGSKDAVECSSYGCTARMGDTQERLVRSAVPVQEGTILTQPGLSGRVQVDARAHGGPG